MQDEHILIDKLEDQIIDHPDASTQHQLHSTSLDETFQNKLNARAEQIKSNQAHESRRTGKDGVNRPAHDPAGGNGSINYQFLINKSHLDYTYRDHEALDQELSEWFTYNDLKVLSIANLRTSYADGTDIGEALSTIESGSIAAANGQLAAALDLLIYYSFGSYAQAFHRSDQLRSIIGNNTDLISKYAYRPLISLLQVFIESITSNETSSKLELGHTSESTYFKVLTLLYFMINVALEIDDDAKADFQLHLEKTDLLSSLLQFLEHWKWNPNNSLRARYLIMTIWKLILLEMGDSNHVKLCDEYLIQKYDIKNKNSGDSATKKLTCSPLDYFAFKEDILDKYPLFDNPTLQSFNFDDFKRTLDEEGIDSNPSNELNLMNELNESSYKKYKEYMALNYYSNSLSNLIESPRTYKSHTVLSQLPAQTVHIATPIPSPTLIASDYMSGGEKIRRSYQVNQAMPFIYPNTEGDLQGLDTNVPLAIKEADRILKDSVYESYSKKRLWEERELFMTQERGYKSEYNQSPDFDTKSSSTKTETSKDELKILRTINRIELFYKKNFIRFNTFIQVLLETIKSNKLDYNLNFPEWELNPETSYLNKNASANFDPETKSKIEFVLMLQLEVINVKEITAKASTGIIFLLLKWFKINHVIKFYYLTSLLFDQQFFTLSLDYLSRSFNNSNLQSTDKDDEITEYEVLINQNKIMNPKIALPKFEFFNNCLNRFPSDFKYKLVNKNIILHLPKIMDDDGISNTYIKEYNENFCFILSNVLNITNKILIPNITQRIFTLNELKPSELYKMIVLNYENEFVTLPILRILKKLVPYQGRKWKSVNMDLISQIYLKTPLTLKDNWLSGKDLESDFNNSYDQEISFRALLQFYNVRNYQKEMEWIGYQVNKDEDIPLLSLGEEEDVYW
ncbi:factor arrest protein 11 [Suhomyces tanzawaensis NRRL Y-17324]|uniref:Factor arrest protein 11 n=1 Tax=Suhomyces tanzawaensis NRRL Y-17324 TaxID=984487 RepID=A0A1E4SCA8_9ASCO|nr:factor arrest protein 11 [Suhomyces tanzawaensis NRRL Y-17324]ODV77147.1 factor arrest protein 11 [Suhomyces tanzawaensis NRRL Y-17324]